jgi:hypothetical protein
VVTHVRVAALGLDVFAETLQGLAGLVYFSDPLAGGGDRRLEI